jgi:hypothetical protein
MRHAIGIGTARKRGRKTSDWRRRAQVAVKGGGSANASGPIQSDGTRYREPSRCPLVSPIPVTVVSSFVGPAPENGAPPALRDHEVLDGILHRS